VPESVHPYGLRTEFVFKQVHLSQLHAWVIVRVYSHEATAMAANMRPIKLMIKKCIMAAGVIFLKPLPEARYRDNTADALAFFKRFQVSQNSYATKAMAHKIRVRTWLANNFRELGTPLRRNRMIGMGHGRHINRIAP